MRSSDIHQARTDSPPTVMNNTDLPAYETISKAISTKDITPPPYTFVTAHPSDFGLEARVPSAPPQYRSRDHSAASVRSPARVDSWCCHVLLVRSVSSFWKYPMVIDVDVEQPGFVWYRSGSEVCSTDWSSVGSSPRARVIGEGYLSSVLLLHRYFFSSDKTSYQ